jgi:hypothetical protein
MDRTARWINDVSAMPVHSQLEGCSTSSNQYDVGAKSTPFSLSPRRPRLSRTSIRGQTPEGSESSSSGFNDSDSSEPINEQLDLEAASDEPGPDDLDDPWPYTFQVSKHLSSIRMKTLSLFRWVIVCGYVQKEGTGILAKYPAQASSMDRLDRYWDLPRTR